MMSKNYKLIIYACFIGYIVQAIVNNFAPLLFLTFQSQYNISLSKITMLISFNFMLQLLIDLAAISFVDKIGYRASAIIAHICAAVGFISLTILPEVMSDPFYGILISVIIYAMGGGLLEVIISPIVEACPSENKEKAMSLLHSFYCWGYVGVVLLSTVFFTIVGITHWKLLTLLWTIVPVFNIILFAKVPIAPLIAEDEKGLSVKELFKMNIFLIFMLVMVCAGACEHVIAQWASLFMEKGLGVSKTIGDLAGPMLFAAFMGLSRVIYGKYGDKIKLESFMFGSAGLCILSYLMISLVPNSFVNVIGCAIAGFSVGILWPGTFSMASAVIKNGGTAMFAFMALAGDLGCSAGPTVVGWISDMFSENLKVGIFAALIFPIILICGILNIKKNNQ